MENLLTLYFQGLAGNQTKNQGVRKIAQFDLRIRRSGVRITLGAPMFSISYAAHRFSIMESLVTLRPEVVQELLEICRLVKVKRLFMYMAEKHRHLWVEKLDLSQIDFGEGKRMIVSGGELNPRYNITVPRE